MRSRYAPQAEVRDAEPELATNHRNGTSGKTVLTDDGPVPIEVPRERAGTFEPQLIGKQERRFTGFDDKVIALYARVWELEGAQTAGDRAAAQLHRPSAEAASAALDDFERNPWVGNSRPSSPRGDAPGRR